MCVFDRAVFSKGGLQRGFLFIFQGCFLTAQSHHRYPQVVHRTLKFVTHWKPQTESLCDDNLNLDNDNMYTVTICRCLGCSDSVLAFSFQLICRWTRCHRTQCTHSARILCNHGGGAVTVTDLWNESQPQGTAVTLSGEAGNGSRTTRCAAD